MTTVGRRPWHLLDAAGALRQGEFHVFESDVRVAAGTVLQALDGEGRRHVLIPMSENAVIEPDRRSGGVHLLPHLLEEGGRRLQFLDVACQKKHLNEVFSFLATEILEELLTSGGDPAAVCLRVMDRWRELLSRQPGSVLGVEAVAGLFGELYHLRELVRRRATAVDAWQGPNRGPHDLVGRRAALEVKAMLGGHTWNVEIHGVLQLQAPPEGTLFLAAMRLRRDPVGGESLPQIMDDIVALGGSRLELLKRLTAVGYSESDAEYYLELSFMLEEERVYQVDASFPRIVPPSFLDGRLPSGISGVRYMIDLTAAASAPLRASDVEQVYDLIVEDL